MSDVIISNDSGSLIKTGAVENGRQKYELTDKTKNKKVVYSVAEKDTFEYEKTVCESIDYVSKLDREDFAKRSQNIDQAKLNKMLKIGSCCGGILGAAIPAGIVALLKTSKKVKLWVGIPLAIGGAIGGFVTGLAATTKHFLNSTVPELKVIGNYADKLNKLDVKLESESNAS